MSTMKEKLEVNRIAYEKALIANEEARNDVRI